MRYCLKQNNLLSNSYSLGNVSIFSSVDTVFWVDKSNEVRFVDSNGYENVLLFLLDEGVVDQETAVTNANDYIISKYISDQTYPNLMYFSMPGCPDCEEASQIISSWGPLRGSVHGGISGCSRFCGYRNFR